MKKLRFDINLTKIAGIAAIIAAWWGLQSANLAELLASVWPAFDPSMQWWGLLGTIIVAAPGWLADTDQDGDVDAQDIFRNVTGNERGWVSVQSAIELGTTVLAALMVVLLVSMLVGCGGSQSSAPALNLGKIPFNLTMVCDVDEDFEADFLPIDAIGVGVVCAGTLEDPTCATEAGLALSCEFATSTRLPFIGTVGAAATATATGGTGEEWRGEVHGCAFASEFEACIVEVFDASTD